jgi:hypothetical protein
MRVLLALTAAGSLLAAAGSLLLAGPAVAQAPADELLPKTIALPMGFQPEGIARGPGNRAFVGILNGGGVVDVNVLTGATRFLVQPRPDRVAVGLAFGGRGNAVFAAGGPTGMAFVYDADSGEEIAALQLTTAMPSLVNDVTVTTAAAFFTDSRRPVIYRVPLGPDGRPMGAAEEIPLGPEFTFSADAINANGIEAVLDGRFLLVVNTTSGELFRIDPSSRAIVRIDLDGGSVVGGDGIRLEGNDLLVVQNAMNQVAQIELNSTLTAGEIELTLTDADLRTPTTIASFDGFLFVVNARFGEIAGGMPAPTDVFTVSRLERPVD